MTKKEESQLHKEIKDKVGVYLRNKGFRVCVEGDEDCSISIVRNSGDVGDGENKYPDVEGVYAGRIFERGEAKIEEDLATEHSITQYKLFARRGDLVIGVPKGNREKIEKIIKKNLTPKEQKSIKTILEF